MAIQVGELLVAIGADDTPLRRAMAEVDRLARGYADRSAYYQNAVNEARKANTAAQRDLNKEQAKYNRLIEKKDKAEKEKKKFSDADREALRETKKRLERVSQVAAERKDELQSAIQLRDLNRQEMQNAKERLAAEKRIKSVTKEVADEKAAENRQTSDEMMARRRMEKSATKDLSKERKNALKEEAAVEKRIADERERYRKLDNNQRRSSILQQLQEREALERDLQRRVADGEKNAQRDLQKLRKRNATDYTKWWEDTLNKQLGPVRGAPQMGQALPAGMRLRSGQLVPIGRQPVQGPSLPPGMRLRNGQLVPIQAPQQQGQALPPGMRMRGGQLVPIVTPRRPPRQPSGGMGAGGGSFGLDTFGITSTLIGTAGLAGLIKTANEMQVIQQRLNQVSESGQVAALAFNKIADSAQRLRQPIAETVELYTKLRQSNDLVGLSANETVKVTQAFSAALRVSGATGQTAASALLQFGQAMAKGNLDGDEFRTVAENASEVLRVLERYLNDTGEGQRLFGVQTKITRAELLKFREEGKLTSDLMSKALLWDLENLTKKAAELPPSLEQGMTSMKNAFLMAMTNTRDVRRAFEDIAIAMVDASEVISESGPFIMGFVKAAAAVAAVTLAVRGLSGALTLLSRNPGILALQVLAATIAVLDERQKRKDAVDFSLVDQAETAAQAQKAALTYAKQVNEISGQIAKKEREKAAMIKKQTEAGFPQIMIDQGVKGYDRDIDALIKKRKELTRAMKEATQREDAFRLMDLKPDKVVPPKKDDKAKGGKTAKDTTDEEIAALLTLFKLGIATEEQLKRLNDLREKQLQISQNTKDVVAQTKALENLKKIEEAAREVYGERDMLGGGANKAKEFAENFEDAFSQMTVEQVQSVVNYLKMLQGQLEQLEPGTTAWSEKLKEIQDIQDKMVKMNPFALFDLPDEKEKKLSMLERHVRNLQRALLDMALSAPGELFSTYFDAMVEAVETGTNRVGERMREKLGSMMKSVGKNLMEQGMSKLADWWKKNWGKTIGSMISSMVGPTTALGKFMLKIKTALANPLVSGVALLAIGAAMAAYGAKMGAIGRGEGAELGGGIGSLGTGAGQDQTLRYTFADRRNPLERNQVVGMPMQPITVQQTIIGPNDPVAQRQIGQLMENAARRGLVRNS